ncbi:MAG: hypothetical protein L0Y58_23640 [Verrucomicrobia subdivision 3 bacterium]|nr:hypothetical protein [Limisphaerales bacterium]
MQWSILLCAAGNLTLAALALWMRARWPERPLRARAKAAPQRGLNADACRELVNLQMSQADVAEGRRRVYSFVAAPEASRSCN